MMCKQGCHSPARRAGLLLRSPPQADDSVSSDASSLDTSEKSQLSVLVRTACVIPSGNECPVEPCRPSARRPPSPQTRTYVLRTEYKYTRALRQARRAYGGGRDGDWVTHYYVRRVGCTCAAVRRGFHRRDAPRGS